MKFLITLSILGITSCGSNYSHRHNKKNLSEIGSILALKIKAGRLIKQKPNSKNNLQLKANITKMIGKLRSHARKCGKNVRRLKKELKIVNIANCKQDSGGETATGNIQLIGIKNKKAIEIKKQIDYCNEQIEDSEKLIKSLKSKKTELYRSIKKAKSEKKTKEEIQTLIKQYQDKLKDIKTTRDEIQIKINDAQEKKQELESKITLIQKEIEGIKQKSEEEEDAYKLTIDDIEKKKDELSKQLKKVQQEIQDLRQNLQELEKEKPEKEKLQKEVAGLKKKMEESKKKADNLQEKVQKQYEDIENKNIKIKEIQEKKDDLNLQLREIQKQKDDLQNEYDTITENINNLKEDQETQKKITFDLQQQQEKVVKVTELNAEIKKLEETQKGQKYEIKDFKFKMDELKKEKEDIEKDLKNLKEKQTKYESLKKGITLLGEQQNKIIAQIDVKQNKIDQINKEEEVLNIDIQNTQKEEDDLQKKVDVLNKNIKQLTKHQKAEKTELDKLKKAVKSKEENVKHLKEEIIKQDQVIKGYQKQIDKISKEKHEEKLKGVQKTELESKIDNLKKEITKLTQDNQQKINQNTHEEDEVNRIQKEKDEVIKSIEELYEKQDYLNKCIKNLSGIIEMFKKEKIEEEELKKKQENDKKQKEEDYKNKLKQIKEDNGKILYSLNNEIEKLENKNNSEVNELGKVKNQYIAAKNQITKQQNELKEIKNKISTLHESFTDLKNKKYKLYDEMHKKKIEPKTLPEQKQQPTKIPKKKSKLISHTSKQLTQEIKKISTKTKQQIKPKPKPRTKEMIYNSIVAMYNNSSFKDYISAFYKDIDRYKGSFTSEQDKISSQIVQENLYKLNGSTMNIFNIDLSQITKLERSMKFILFTIFFNCYCNANFLNALKNKGIDLPAHYNSLQSYIDFFKNNKSIFLNKLDSMDINIIQNKVNEIYKIINNNSESFSPDKLYNIISEKSYKNFKIRVVNTFQQDYLSGNCFLVSLFTWLKYYKKVYNPSILDFLTKLKNVHADTMDLERISPDIEKNGIYLKKLVKEEDDMYTTSSFQEVDTCTEGVSFGASSLIYGNFLFKNQIRNFFHEKNEQLKLIVNTTDAKTREKFSQNKQAPSGHWFLIVIKKDPSQPSKFLANIHESYRQNIAYFTNDNEYIKDKVKVLIDCLLRLKDKIIS